MNNMKIVFVLLSFILVFSFGYSSDCFSYGKYLKSSAGTLSPLVGTQTGTIYECYKDTPMCKLELKTYDLQYADMLCNKSQNQNTTIANPWLDCSLGNYTETMGAIVKSDSGILKCFNYGLINSKDITCYNKFGDSPIFITLNASGFVKYFKLGATTNNVFCVPESEFNAFFEPKKNVVKIGPNKTADVKVTPIGNANVCFGNYFKFGLSEIKPVPKESANYMCYFYEANKDGFDCIKFLQANLSQADQKELSIFYKSKYGTETSLACVSKVANSYNKLVALNTATLKPTVVAKKPTIQKPKKDTKIDNYAVINKMLDSDLTRTLVVDSPKELAQLYKYKRGLEYLAIDPSFTKEVVKDNKSLSNLVVARDKARSDLTQMYANGFFNDNILAELSFESLGKEVRTMIAKNASEGTSLAKYFGEQNMKIDGMEKAIAKAAEEKGTEMSPIDSGTITIVAGSDSKCPKNNIEMLKGLAKTGLELFGNSANCKDCYYLNTSDYGACKYDKLGNNVALTPTEKTQVIAAYNAQKSSAVATLPSNNTDPTPNTSGNTVANAPLINTTNNINLSVNSEELQYVSMGPNTIPSTLNVVRNDMHPVNCSKYFKVCQKVIALRNKHVKLESDFANSACINKNQYNSSDCMVSERQNYKNLYYIRDQAEFDVLAPKVYAYMEQNPNGVSTMVASN